MRHVLEISGFGQLDLRLGLAVAQSENEASAQDPLAFGCRGEAYCGRPTFGARG